MKFKRLVVVFLFFLAGCDGLIGAPPTRTPTPDMPPLAASPTVNPLPPTAISNDSFVQNNPTAAAAPNNSDTNPALDATLAVEIDPNKPTLLNIRTEDGGTLSAEYYAISGQRPPVALIVGTQNDNWAGFPLVLRNAGYAVLVVNMRVPALQGDFAAVINTLSTLEVDASKIGVIGASAGADVALVSCAAEPRCSTLVLLSPSQIEAGLTAIRDYNPRSLLLLASQEDEGIVQTSDAIRRAATGDVSLQTFAEAGRGTQMVLNRAEVGTIIVDWLNRHLKS